MLCCIKYKLKRQLPKSILSGYGKNTSATKGYYPTLASTMRKMCWATVDRNSAGSINGFYYFYTTTSNARTGLVVLATREHLSDIGNVGLAAEYFHQLGLVIANVALHDVHTGAEQSLERVHIQKCYFHVVHGIR